MMVAADQDTANKKIQIMMEYFKKPLKQFPLFPFQIDTNLINIKGEIENMNQIEKWDENGIVSLFFSNIVMNELKKCLEDFEKALESFPKNIQMNIRKKSERISGKLFKMVDLEDEKCLNFKKIESILFPDGFKQDNEENNRNDVRIVFSAYKYRDILLTNDGGSKSQPMGILGNAQILQTKLGVKIMRHSEAVNMVQNEIDKLNENARIYTRETGIQLELFT